MTWQRDLFEGHEIVPGSLKSSDDPALIRQLLQSWYLDHDGTAGIPAEDSARGRAPAPSSCSASRRSARSGGSSSGEGHE
jgi:hypothetical protein